MAENENTAFATVEDVEALWRPLSTEEATRVEQLLPVVSDMLRQAAINAGRDLDAMIAAQPTLSSVAKAVTVDVTARIMRQSTEGEPVSSETQTALGYTWQGTYAVPGGGIAGAIMRTDLKRLGIVRQKMEAIDLDPWYKRHFAPAYTDGD